MQSSPEGTVPEAESAGALEWLDGALDHARNHDKRSLEALLEAVWREVVLDLELSRGSIRLMGDGDLW